MYYAQLTLAEVDQEIKNGRGTKEQSSHRDYKHEDAKREDFIRESIAAKMWIIHVHKCGFYFIDPVITSLLHLVVFIMLWFLCM